ncbi:MAG: hypothetical protein AB4058_03530 [Microcystaceae cyanobacterium]
MEKLGVLVTSLLLTVSLLFYASRPQSDLKTEEIHSQQQFVTSVSSDKKRKYYLLSPFLMKTKRLVSFLAY